MDRGRASGIDRRGFVALLGGAAVAWPTVARAQQAGRQRRVGALMGFPEGDPYGRACLAALREGLRGLGWVEGRNLQLDVRWPGGDPEKARAYARELIGLGAEVLVPSTNQVVAIARQETKTIPIVFAYIGDPVGSGLVDSLHKPGGNVTGFPAFVYTLGGKWLELFKEIAPGAGHVGFIVHPNVAPHAGLLRAAEAAAPALKTKVMPLSVRNAAEIERGIAEVAAEPGGGLLVAAHAVTVANRDLIIALAERHRLPTVFGDRAFVEKGGLMSYGNNGVDQFRRAASYVDLILKGAKPADLPVQLPTKFELILNLKTAKAIGLKVPDAFLLRADEVIE